MMGPLGLGLLVAASVALAMPCVAGSLTVGTGASVDLSTGSLDTGAGDLDVAGTFSAGSQSVDARNVDIQATGILNGNSALIQVCGDWSNAGSFNAGSGTVAFVDGCSVTSSTITGANSFNDLSLTTVTGKQVNLEAGVTQTVAGTFTLGGASGNLLVLRSTVGGSAAFLGTPGAMGGDYVDVNDVDATPGQHIIVGQNSLLGSNTPGWSAFPAAVPALGLLGLLALWAGLAASGCRMLGREAKLVR